MPSAAATSPGGRVASHYLSPAARAFCARAHACTRGFALHGHKNKNRHHQNILSCLTSFLLPTSTSLYLPYGSLLVVGLLLPAVDMSMLQALPPNLVFLFSPDLLICILFRHCTSLVAACMCVDSVKIW